MGAFQQLVFGILLAVAVCQVSARAAEAEKKAPLKVAVIGAGTSGLVSAKYSLARGYDVTVYEQTAQIGGIWWFTNQTGKDEYGINIHSPMYLGLRTNLPHQIMEFVDHKYPDGSVSYPPQADVLKYLHSYADRFDVNKHIKFNHHVIRVNPIEDGKWEIIVKDQPNNKYETVIYDAVFVANGHFSKPKIPKIPGQNEYKGRLIHSRDYRNPEDYRGQSVLVIGAGASGMDLILHLSKIAERMTTSQNRRPHETKDAREKRQKMLPPNVQLQDNVKRFTATGVEFIDGTEQSFDTIFYATGYDFSYPFLTVDTGIHVDDNFVTPLFKQVLNIDHPTMAFIGIPFTTSTTPTYDLQVRFALKFISGEKELPSKTNMMLDMRAQTQIQWNKGYPKHYTHYLGPEAKEYYKQLSETAEIENLPNVLAAVHFDTRAAMVVAPSQFRKYKYTIVDDNTFTKVKYED